LSPATLVGFAVWKGLTCPCPSTGNHLLFCLLSSLECATTCKGCGWKPPLVSSFIFTRVCYDL
jgi:uncharacterized protein (DUF983 family)